MRTLRVLTWSATGATIGALMGTFGVVTDPWGTGMIGLLALVGWSVAVIGPLTLASLGGRTFRNLYYPYGRTTPHARGHSQAESLVARGLYEDAIEAYQVAMAEDSSGPTPYRRIARVYRDGLHRYEDSARWFKRALEESRMAPEGALLTLRELLELYETKLGQPGRAAPLLARVAEERAGTLEGDWAAEELVRVKARIAVNRDH